MKNHLPPALASHENRPEATIQATADARGESINGLTNKALLAPWAYRVA